MTGLLLNLYLTGLCLLAPVTIFALIQLFLGSRWAKLSARVCLWLSATAILACYAALWMRLERPPMVTLGETKILCGLLMLLLYIPIEATRKQRGLPLVTLLTVLVAGIFLLNPVLHPENMETARAPALQSPWFAPHVVVYIFAYAAFAIACIQAGIALVKSRFRPQSDWMEEAAEAANMTFLGFPFLNLGLLFGALWAKEAWGHYWTWDPKETWALITWGAYLAFFHLRKSGDWSPKKTAIILLVGFPLILMTYLGVNALPTSGQSVHTYAEQATGK